MAEFFETITDKMAAFIAEQSVFFTATACSTGRVNLSPKGMDSFRVLSPTLCGYLDMVGSGNETAAHINNDGRLTFMFNSFSRRALIVRLYGKGRVVRPHHAEFDALAEKFETKRGQRQIILMDVESTQTACGWGVPEMELKAVRGTHAKAIAGMNDEELAAKIQANNLVSIDGFESGLND